MRYVVVLGDGMADRPIPELGGRTPLEAARTPNMDMIAGRGLLGRARTVPDGMKPGSDTANLSVMGYDPKLYYSGRSPLEAVSMGVPLADGDMTWRCNLVTLSDAENIEDATVVDHSSGEITTAEAHELIEYLNQAFGERGLRIYPGSSFRHCYLVHDGRPGTELTPPHDILGRRAGDYLPKGTYAGDMLYMMRLSHALLPFHPVNLARRAKGLHEANCVWFWGEGVKPLLDDFRQLNGVFGGVVAAVDLLKGIAISANMACPNVPGATGTIDTDYEGKVAAALELLRGGCEFVYIHLEAPDECGHAGDAAEKLRSIELLDERIVGPVLRALDADGEPYSILVTPDHPTPIETRTHSAEPVPFALMRSDAPAAPPRPYCEREAANADVLPGCRLLPLMLGGKY